MTLVWMVGANREVQHDAERVGPLGAQILLEG